MATAVTMTNSLTPSSPWSSIFNHRNCPSFPSKIAPPNSIKTLNPPPKKSTKISQVSKFSNSSTKQEEIIYPLSIPLHQKNPNAICKDIQKFARKNKLKEALTILDYLDQLGIPVNPSTFSALIAACIRSKSLVQAKQIHTHIRINGLETNEFLKTKIVQMYASCGSIDDAKRVFDEGPTNQSVYQFNALLRGNVVSGGHSYRDMLGAFSRMRENGGELNVYSFSCLIKSFGGSGAFRQGLKMHSLLIKNGFIGSMMLKTCLIDMYCKCGKVKVAHLLFDEMPERDIVVWGAMIAGFAHNNLQDEAIKYVRLMINEGILPNSVVLTTILPIIGDVGAWKLGKEVHAYVFKRGKYLEQPFIKSALIDMYCKCGDMTSGRKVFYTSKDRTTVSWTALMSGYIANGRLDQALRSIIWMQQEGFRPDVVSLATILPACAKLRALSRGKEIHGYLVKNEFLPNVSLTTSLIVMYSKCGVLKYSNRLFGNMERRNVIAWTAFIDSCMENGRPYEALEVFRSMQLSKHRADAVTISRVLGLCSKLRLLKLGKEAYGQVLKKAIERVPFVNAGLVEMYGECREIEMAKLVFDLNLSQGLMAVNAMIAAYGHDNDFRGAIALFDQMMEKGVAPNEIIFSTVLGICDRAGFVDEARRIFQLMTRRYRISASKEHYSVIVGLLTRLGHIQEAERYIQWSSELGS